ncbi:DEAD/DEAH box helicase family protein [Wolbachia endosymbiont of Pentidionis agamae]|uniref:DEAD/DEAH box helicase family protein n=1 Tax=Wolbachia endosymbiont of Pentidionis agamae TaxID=3110435 RepID=UPI002FD573A6
MVVALNLEQLKDSAEAIYNSYLLLYKLNNLNVDKGRSLKEVISTAICANSQQAKFEVDGKEYEIEIIKNEDSSYNINVLKASDKPEVKEVQKYTDEEVMSLWAGSEVSVEMDQDNKLAFFVNLHDRSRKQTLKVGGRGKMIPSEMRFFYFYKVIELLKNIKVETKEITFDELSKHLRLADNIATGSGKTGDIALIKLLCYLENISCVVAVPNQSLVAQSIKFDREFLPDQVCEAFKNSLLDEANSKYITADFDTMLNQEWKSFYERCNKENLVLCFDEVPKLKENLFFLKRAAIVSENSPTMIFSATPDKYINKEMNINNNIFLSPKTRSDLGMGKLPEVLFKKTQSPIEDYILVDECNHWVVKDNVKVNKKPNSQ